MKLVNVFFFAFFYTWEIRIVMSQYSGCGDALGSYTCYNWYMNGMCNDHTYRYLMVENCQKTCNFCPIWTGSTSKDAKITCQDNRQSCKKWRNHCQQNSVYYKFMTRNCKRACLFCEDENCIDVNDRCEKYRILGYCVEKHKYYHFMSKNCENSCKFCLPTHKETKVDGNIQSYNKEFLCDFEIHECDWLNLQIKDATNWVVGVDEHGPMTGFNSSRNYLYLNTKHEGYPGNIRLPWELILPSNEAEKGKMCFHFMYQMNHGGKIIVSQKVNPTLSTKYPSAIVRFSTEEMTTSWTHVKVNVYVSDNFELIVKGVKSQTKSYLCIDYVFFTDGECF